MPTRLIKPLARAGYAARGLVYLVIGIFAILAARGGDEKDSEGAVSALLAQPFGTLIVWCLIVGLFGYVLWRLIQAIADTDDHGTGLKGLAIRAGLLASAFTYGALAIFSLSLVGVFSGSPSSDSGGDQPIAEFMAGFVGSRIVALGIAVIFLGVAIAHVWKAVTQKYEAHFDAPDQTMAFIHPIAMIGLVARGAVLAVVALLFFYRFLQQPDSSGGQPGLEAALQFIQGLPFGSALLVATGLGLVAFAAYSFIKAYWRRIVPG